MPPYYPKLLDPVNVTILPIDRTETIYDEDAREEIQVIKRSNTIVIPAQLEFREQLQAGIASASYSETGLMQDEEGYLAIRWRDANALSYSPAIGDKIIELGTGTQQPTPVESWVKRLKPFAHKPYWGMTMVKLYFKDKNPVGT